MTFAFAVPETDPLVAVMVTVPGEEGAVNKPLASMEPALAAPGENRLGHHSVPNWSSGDGGILLRCEAIIAAVGGLTVMLPTPWVTVTETLLVTERPTESVIVAMKEYDPSAPKVTVVFFAALVPLGLNVGAGDPLGWAVVDQV